MIYLIRHAPTKCNVDNIFMGTLDFDIDLPVNEAAIASLRLSLRNVESAAIVSSPLKRCIQSVELILPGRDFRLDHRIQERYLGDWQGEKKEDVKKKYPLFFNADGSMNIIKRPPHGESFDDFCLRVKSFMDDANKLDEEASNVIVFTHGGVIAAAHFLLGRVHGTFFGTHEYKHLGVYPL